MIIREIVSKDFSEALECIQKSVDVSNRPDYPVKIIDYQLHTHYVLSWVENAAASKYFVVAEIEDSVVGTGALKDNEIQNVFVSPDYQKDGIGKAIINHLESYASIQGYSNVFLESSISAVLFYQKLGYYIQIDEIIDWLEEKIRRIRMVKVL